jgi:hypothetical protein
MSLPTGKGGTFGQRRLRQRRGGVEESHKPAGRRALVAARCETGCERREEGRPAGVSPSAAYDASPTGWSRRRTEGEAQRLLAVPHRNVLAVSSGLGREHGKTGCCRFVLAFVDITGSQDSQRSARSERVEMRGNSLVLEAAAVLRSANR